jgi:hypothetical protein
MMPERLIDATRDARAGKITNGEWLGRLDDNVTSCSGQRNSPTKRDEPRWFARRAAQLEAAGQRCVRGITAQTFLMGFVVVSADLRKLQATRDEWLKSPNDIHREARRDAKASYRAARKEREDRAAPWDNFPLKNSLEPAAEKASPTPRMLALIETARLRYRPLTAPKAKGSRNLGSLYFIRSYANTCQK